MKATHPTEAEQMATTGVNDYAVKPDEPQRGYYKNLFEKAAQQGYGSLLAAPVANRFGDRKDTGRTAPTTQQGAFFMPAVCSMAGRYGQSKDWPVSLCAGSPTRNFPASFCLATEGAVNSQHKETRNMSESTFTPYSNAGLTIHIIVNITAPHETDTQTLRARLAGALISELSREALPVSGCFAAVREV